MKKVLVPLAPGFEEIETVTVVDILRRAGARVTVAGVESGAIEGSRGIHLVPDELLDSVNPGEFDLVVLPGGQPGTNNLLKDKRVAGLLKQMREADRVIGAICAAPTILHALGFLKDKKATSHPSVEDQLSDVDYSQERVVVDNNLVTSRGPGTALEFAFKLVEILFGKDRVETVNKGVMAKI